MRMCNSNVNVFEACKKAFKVRNVSEKNSLILGCFSFNNNAGESFIEFSGSHRVWGNKNLDASMFKERSICNASSACKSLSFKNFHDFRRGCGCINSVLHGKKEKRVFINFS